MVRSVPAPLNTVARSRGRGATSQEEAEARTAGDQGTSKAAMEGPMENWDEAEEQDDEEDEDKDSQSGDESSSSSGEPSKDEKQLKPPARSKGAKKTKQNEDPDKGKEGTADDIPIPCKM